MNNLEILNEIIDGDRHGMDWLCSLLKEIEIEHGKDVLEKIITALGTEIDTYHTYAERLNKAKQCLNNGELLEEAIQKAKNY